MTLSIDGEEVAVLLEEYAKREGKDKATALRDLLRRELQVIEPTSSEERYHNAIQFVLSAPTETHPISADAFHNLFSDLNDAH